MAHHDEPTVDDHVIDPAFDWPLDNGATFNVLARYHVDQYLDTHVIDIGAPCTDDDCTRDDHVNVSAHDIPGFDLDDIGPPPNLHVFTDAQLDEQFVERPRFHEHDDFVDRATSGVYHHDHDGRAIAHYHWPDAVQYVAGDRVIPRPVDE